MTRKELLDADWARLAAVGGVPQTARRWYHGFSPRFAAIYLLRTAAALHSGGWRSLARMCSLINFVLFGIEVPSALRIGPGLILPHPQGVILGGARIGANATIFQQVTLGAKLADWTYDVATRPVVEDGVTIAAGAKVLGPVTLGAGCIVGANAVVLQDVAPGAIVGGVPAQVISAPAAAAS